MKSEFKERTFEKIFDYEMSLLANGPAYSFSPHDEQWLGFDSAFCLLPFHYLWRILAPQYLGRFISWLLFQTPHSGILLADIDLLPKGRVDYMPKCLMNLFFQYKRPEYLTQASAKEWADYKQPYYRYGLKVGSKDPMHQHKVLASLKSHVKERGEVFYVAAAFHTVNKLLEHVNNRKIIDNSHFASIDNIKSSHRSVTYHQPGIGGKAHSEAEDIESERLERVLHWLRQRRRTEIDTPFVEFEEEPLDFFQHVKNTAISMNAAIFESDEKEENPIAQKRFISTRSTLLRLLGEENGDNFRFNGELFGHAVITVFSYCGTFDLDMLMVTV